MTKQKGAVAAGHRVTAEAAADVLREGGNAFDAALAAMMTACVPEFVFSSIGGGGHLMAFDAGTGHTHLFDFFVQTPRHKHSADGLDFEAITADFGPATQEFHIGAGSTATPGMVPGFHAVHEALCTLPAKRLLEPAINAAREGVTVSDLHGYLYTIVAPILTATDAARAHFTREGKLFTGGDTYRNSDFALLLEALASDGPRLFSEGEVAQAIVAQSERLGGHLRIEDLKAYKVERREPLMRAYHGNHVALNPAPAASGAMIGFGLALLENHDRHGNAADALTLARVMEQTNAAREANGKSLDALTSDSVIARHFEAIKDHAPAYRGTTHISVIDAAGNAAAVTITNGEGNGHVVEGCGFMLNNMLGEEDLNPGGFHQWRENMRLSTMMAPTLIRGEDDTLTALGSGGSNRIRTAILQAIVNLLSRNLRLEDAINAARIHLERDGALSLEDGPWDEILPAAEKSKLLEHYPEAHRWPDLNLFFGGVHAVRRSGGGALEGAGDPRRGGIALVV